MPETVTLRLSPLVVAASPAPEIAVTAEPAGIYRYALTSPFANVLPSQRPVTVILVTVRDVDPPLITFGVATVVYTFGEPPPYVLPPSVTLPDEAINNNVLPPLPPPPVLPSCRQLSNFISNFEESKKKKKAVAKKKTSTNLELFMGAI